MATIAELLRAARAKIERPECWTRGECARDADGHKIGVKSARAASWCALGAMMAQGCTQRKAAEILAPHLPENKCWLVYEYNDRDAAHADILNLYDRAIAASETSNAA